MDKRGKNIQGLILVVAIIGTALIFGIAGTMKELNAQEVLEFPAGTDKDFKKALQSGTPVLVDFGASKCIPCRKLRPILKEISEEFKGKAQILVIDVYEYQKLAREQRVQLIPTLIFFDSSGKEVFRHVGFLEKASIVKKLKEIGVG
jgi:thioredoxin 1